MVKKTQQKSRSAATKLFHGQNAICVFVRCQLPMTPAHGRSEQVKVVERSEVDHSKDILLLFNGVISINELITLHE